VSPSSLSRWGRRLALGILAVFVVIQFIPIGAGKTNPEGGREVTWDSDRTKQLVERACYDCHSNKTVWPWYSYVAPVSWLVEHDVHEGREHLNFSEWDKEQKHADEAAEEVEDGEMPLRIYTLLHPEARLEGAARAHLIEGLKKTLGD